MGLNSLIIDTSFFIALAKPSDLHHSKAKKLAKLYCKRKWVTTWPVITELSHLLPTHTFLALMEDQQKGLFHIFSLSDKDIPTILDLMKKYRDQEIDLADLSLIILADQMEQGSILSFDRNDFSFLKWRGSHPFENLALQTKK